jgi:hypothetical protein
MAHKNKKTSKTSQKSSSKNAKDNVKRPQRQWDQETSADIPYDDSVESPRGRSTPSMY